MERLEFWQPNFYEPPADILTRHAMRRAFMSAILVAYSRPFGKSDAGWLPLSVDLLQYDADELAAHNLFREIRHLSIAHAAGSVHRLRVYFTETGIQTTADHPPRELTREGVDCISALARKAEQVLSLEIVRLAKRIRGT
ncbi:hypothetical protein [Dokdonella fugitiva]|nr:hypothetical protein [Dokdonella fugitiva]